METEQPPGTPRSTATEELAAPGLAARIGAWTRPGTLSARSLVAALVILAVLIATWRLTTVFSDPILPGQPWQSGKTYLGDFRDLIYGPGRFLLSGGNPYDPQLYIAATPGSPEFDPYAPIWLLLSITFCMLPYKVGGLLYEIFGLCVLMGFSATIVRIARLPRPLIVTLALFCAFVIWYPTRAAASGSSLIVALGVLVALSYFRNRPWLAGVGVALSLVKPQFGLPLLLMLLALRATGAVWRGVVLLVGSSAPFLIWTVVNAGGVPQFVDSIIRDIQYASGAGAATGLASPQQFRIDLLGILARDTGDTPAGWLQLAVPVVLLVVSMVALARSRGSMLGPILATTAMFLCIVHFPYDLPVVAGPAIIGLTALVRAPALRRPATIAAVTAVALLFLHIHAIDRVILPGISDRTMDTVDTVLVLLAWVAAVIAVVRREHLGPARAFLTWPELPPGIPRPVPAAAR